MLKIVYVVLCFLLIICLKALWPSFWTRSKLKWDSFLSFLSKKTVFISCFFAFNVFNTILVFTSCFFQCARLDYLILASYIGLGFLLFSHHPYAVEVKRERENLSLFAHFLLLFRPAAFTLAYSALLVSLYSITTFLINSFGYSDNLYFLLIFLLFLFLGAVLGYLLKIKSRKDKGQYLTENISLSKIHFYYKRYVNAEKKWDFLPFFISLFTYIRASSLCFWLVFCLSVRFDNGLFVCIVLNVYHFLSFFFLCEFFKIYIKKNYGNKALHLLGGNNPLEGGSKVSGRATKVGLGVAVTAAVATPLEEKYHEVSLKKAIKQYEEKCTFLREQNDANPFAPVQHANPYKDPERVLFPGSLRWWNSHSSNSFFGTLNRFVFGKNAPKAPEFGGPKKEKED